MSAATQSIRSSPLPSVLRYDPTASSSSESLRHVTSREQPPQLGRLETGTLRNVGHDEWNDERHRHLLIGHRVCYRCKWRIEINPTLTKSDPVKLVHLTCTNCSATQCRGCSTPQPRCTSRCDERTCRSEVITCCAGSRAIAIFEALSEFDKEFSAHAAQLSQSGVWPVPRQERREFLELVTSRADARLSNQFNRLVGATVNVVNKCIDPTTASAHDGSGSDADLELDPVIRPLLTTSFLFEAIHAYLHHSYYINWAINARDVYLPVLALLHTLGNRHSLADMLMHPLPALRVSSGVQASVWYHEYQDQGHRASDGPGEERWVSDGTYTESLFAAVFSNGAQQCITDLERLLERRGSVEPTSQIRVAFYRLLVLDIMGAALP